VSGEGDVDILAADLGDKLAAGDVAIEIDFVILDLRLTLSEDRVC
jgi:hypothetical protein